MPGRGQALAGVSGACPSFTVSPRPLYLPVRVLVTAETFTLSSNIIMDTSTFLLRYTAPPSRAGLQLALPLGAVYLLCPPATL